MRAYGMEPKAQCNGRRRACTGYNSGGAQISLNGISDCQTFTCGEPEHSAVCPAKKVRRFFSERFEFLCGPTHTSEIGGNFSDSSAGGTKFISKYGTSMALPGLYFRFGSLAGTKSFTSRHSSS